MMEIQVFVDESSAERWLVNLFEEQIPFAAKEAINAVALEFQRVQQRHMTSIFEIRRERFMKRSVKIKPFARKRSLEARIAIESPRGRSDIFGKFEDQRIKRPFQGRSVAVPTAHTPRTPAGVVSNPWRPKRLLEEATQHGRGRVLARRGDVFRGARRTFLIRRPGGRGTIFLRTSAGLQALYQLVPQVPIQPDLNFESNARRVVSRTWATEMTSAFNRAVLSARRQRTGVARAAAGLARAAS